MDLLDHAASTVNATGTDQEIDTPLTQARSRDVLRRELILTDHRGTHERTLHRLAKPHQEKIGEHDVYDRF